MPALAPTPRRYPVAMMVIHWLTAASIATVVVLAWLFPGGKANDSSVLLLVHRSVGLTILALTVLRLVLRGTLPVPAEPDAASRLQKLENFAARIVHFLLYVILIAMPVSGFLWTTSRGTPVDVFGLFSIPPLLPASDAVHSVARAIHSTGQFAVYAVVALHVAAALFHLVVRRDGVMDRMLPGAQLTPPLPAAAARPGVR